jgi:hypothetical protein
VTVDGDLVRTKYFEYSRKEIEDTICSELDDACLPALLGGKNSSACPTPNGEGHEPGGRLHDCKGKDLWALGKKRTDVDAQPPRGKGRPGFGRANTGPHQPCPPSGPPPSFWRPPRQRRAQASS